VFGRGYNEPKTMAAEPARPRMNRLICSEPAPLPKELPEDVALPKVDTGATDVWLKVALADKFADELDMYMVVVALASTRVLVIVAVEIWVEVVVVSVLASTEAGAHRAASATAVNVKRICRDCGISL